MNKYFVAALIAGLGVSTAVLASEKEGKETVLQTNTVEVKVDMEKLNKEGHRVVDNASEGLAKGSKEAKKLGNKLFGKKK